MGKYKLYFCDYFEDLEVSAADAYTNLANKEVIIEKMQDVLHSSGNFVGIIDDQDVSLQFVVSGDDEVITVDIPSVSDQGSFCKDVTLDEAIDIVRELEGDFDLSTIEGLELRPW